MTEEEIRKDERKKVLDSLRNDFYCHYTGGDCCAGKEQCKTCSDYAIDFSDAFGEWC